MLQYLEAIIINGTENRESRFLGFIKPEEFSIEKHQNVIYNDKNLKIWIWCKPEGLEETDLLVSMGKWVRFPPIKSPDVLSQGQNPKQ